MTSKERTSHRILGSLRAVDGKGAVRMQDRFDTGIDDLWSALIDPRRLARWLDNPAMLQPELMTLMWAAIRGYRIEPKFPGVLTDDELGAIAVPVLLITGARSAMLTPAEAQARGRLMPHAEIAIVPGSHGGFNRIDELNDRIAAFIKAHATSEQPAQPTQPPATDR